MTVMSDREDVAVGAPAGSGQRGPAAHAADLDAVLESVPAIVWIAHDPDCQRITGSRASRELLRMAQDSNAPGAAPAAGWPGHLRATGDRQCPGPRHPRHPAGPARRPR
jgi:hypothetical protein